MADKPTGHGWLHRTRRGTFATDAALSLFAAVVAAAITLLTLPYIVHRMGLAAYGLFVLLGVATSYIGALDFGFGWTTARFVADALERRDGERVKQLLRASLALYAAIGLVGLVVLSVGAHLLVAHVFDVPADKERAGETAARVFAIGVPFAMLQVYASAVLRGARRFDLVATVQLGATVATTAGIVVALALGGSLVAASVGLIIGQGIVATIAVGMTLWVMPKMLTLGRVDARVFREIGRFAGAVGIGNLGAQLLYLPNRLAVGVLLPVRAVTFFTIPFSLAQRLMFVPSALVSAALPSLTGAFTRHGDEEFADLFWRLVAYCVGILLPGLLLAAVWARPLLDLWIGQQFPPEVMWVLRLGLAAVLLNALTAALGVACDSAGLPGVPAIATLAAGVINTVLAFALGSAFGLVGAAAAFLVGTTALAATIALLWRHRGLPALHIRRRARARSGPAIAVAAAAIVWIVGLVATIPALASRADLVVGALIALAPPYVLIVALFKPWRAAGLMLSRAKTDS